MQILLTQIIFYVFGAVLLISSMMVTLTRRSVHAVLWLILAFVATAGLWILIEAEFLGLILVIVYVGAVMTLFLFVVMMLDLQEENISQHRYTAWISFAALFLVMSGILLTLLVAPNLVNVTAQAVSSTSNLTQIGLALFGQEALTIELAAAILLVAIIGAIYLTHRTHSYRKKQVISKQHQATKQDRLKIIKNW